MNNRRNFLKLSAGMAVGSLAAALPASAAECKDTIKWDETHDIIIIGSGFAGLSAAINTKRQGINKVLVLEKMMQFGGNSAINGGWFAVPRNPTQLAQGIVNDSPEELVKDQVIAGRGLASEPHLLAIANRALDAYHLCVDSGVKFRDGFNQLVGGHNIARAVRTVDGTGGEITRNLYRVAKNEGVDLRNQQYVEDFIMEGNKVIGLKVRRNFRFPNLKTGEVVHIKADKGVVIATGGFAMNKELCAIFDPSIDPSMDCTNAHGATGEVTLTAMSHGALPVHMNMIQTGHWGSPDEGGFGWSNALLSITFHQGMIVSVLDSKRFMNERLDRKYCSDRILAQRNPDNSPAYPVGFFNANDFSLDDDRIGRALRDEMAWKLDSVQALADKFNMDAKALQASIDLYNQHVKRQNDPLFDREMDTAKHLAPPFIASRLWPKVHYCMGGLKTDADGRVIASKTLAPMENLYALGEATGGIHGVNRLSSCACLEGLAMGFVVANTITDTNAEQLKG
ncbi:flavocytochrome c [Shewanella sp. SNU WT4]|uniref:flavocytochrome c n=1 Tax=Shewanella sp. SNU WT4 TaxID=2590015 RepID=UPI00112BDCE2|nr:flavocytochrome c [Shewanella sp. SNU WT4]QDF66651.1 flavocytochrome c [Shewanella sp. SNU WT4]